MLINKPREKVALLALSATTIFCLFELIGRSLKSNELNFDLRNTLLPLIFVAVVLLIWRLFFRRMALVAYLGFLALLLILFSGKIGALLAVCVLILGSLSLACGLAKIFKNSENYVPPAGALEFLGLVANGSLFWLLMHFPINYTALYYAILVAEILLFRRPLLDYLRTAKQNFKLHVVHPGIKLLSVFFLVHLIYVLFPAYDFDTLVLQLYLAKAVALTHVAPFSPPLHAAVLNTAIAPVGLYTASFLLGGEFANRLLNFFVFYAGVAFLANYLSQDENRSAGFWGVVVLLTTPFILFQITYPITDSFSLLASVALLTTFFHLVKNSAQLGSWRLQLIFFLLCAACFFCKQQTIFVSIPATLFVVISEVAYFRGKNLLPVLAKTLLSGLLAAGLVASVLVHNWVISGNPLFPFYNAVFKSPFFQPQNFKDSRWDLSFHWDSLFDITTHGSKYVENGNFCFGLWTLAFAPVLLLLFKPNKKIFFQMGLLALGIPLWFLTTGPYIRYFVVLLPVLAMLIGQAIDRLAQLGKEARWLLFTACALIAGINVVAQLNLFHLPRPYPLFEILGKEPVGVALDYYPNQKDVYDYAKLKYGVQAKGLLVDTPTLYFADFSVESIQWYHYTTTQRAMAGATDGPSLLYNIFKKSGFDFIIGPATKPEWQNSLGLRKYLYDGWDLLVLEYESGPLALYRPGKKLIDAWASEGYLRP